MIKNLMAMGALWFATLIRAGIMVYAMTSHFALKNNQLLMVMGAPWFATLIRAGIMVYAMLSHYVLRSQPQPLQSTLK